MMGAVASSPAPIRFRPMPLPELLDELFRLYRRHFSLIVSVALLVALPGLVWSLVTGIYKLNGASYANLITTAPGAQPSFNSQQLTNLLGLLALGLIGGFFLLPLTPGGVFLAVTGPALGRPATLGSGLRGTPGRYFPLLRLAAPGVFLFLCSVL